MGSAGDGGAAAEWAGGTQWTVWCVLSGLVVHSGLCGVC